MSLKLEATELRGGRYAVLPEGCLGTCGWHNGVPWTVFYTKARSKEDAIRRAKIHNHFKEPQKDRFLAACGVESVKECQNG